LINLFLHQVIVGSEEGPLQLWNISTKKKLYDFKGWESPVRCSVSSPALDVVAVGCSDGTVHVHNIRYDEELMSFNHQIRGAVTALSFGTGNLINILLSVIFFTLCSQPYF
jgi:U3 small nucleolar RNA-associated protein 21